MNARPYSMQRFWIITGYLLAVGLLASTIWSYGYFQALNQLSAKAEADLELAADRLSSQLQVYQELAVLMSDHPALRDLSSLQNRREASALLLEVADKTAAVEVLFAAPNGEIIAAAQNVVPDTVSGHPAFERALHGALGSSHGTLPSTGSRTYSFAAPTFGSDGLVSGALMVIADVEDVESTWRGSTEAVFFVDRTGRVFISNRSELLNWQRGVGETGLTPPQSEASNFAASQLGQHEIWRLGWGPYLPQYALHLARDLPVIGMTGEILMDAAPARRLATLQAATVAALCLAFGALLYLATERRRTLANANAVLENRVAERTQELTAANVALRREVVEREEAEEALKRAQAELVQAGKLSALGQMSAGISHELNQPLMAIRQFADNGTAFLQRGKHAQAGENLGRISEMAKRMARIIKNLRAFARNESEPMGKVDLVQVLNTAVELTGPRLKSDDVKMLWDEPNAPIYAWGGEVRLVQVFVNLINNAADAMEGQSNKQITVSLSANQKLAVSIRDSGPGIEDPERVFEPFYTTKAVGSSEGMGLGLSISYGLVQSFGGIIRGSNTSDGAEFTVELEPFLKDKAA